MIAKLPAGLDEVVGQGGHSLSEGEAQRVTIARALLKDAPILIMDEPTSALDTETESLVLAAVREAMRGRTTLVIAHRLSTIQNADRILVLRDGVIAEQGSFANCFRAADSSATSTICRRGQEAAAAKSGTAATRKISHVETNHDRTHRRNRIGQKHGDQNSGRARRDRDRRRQSRA